MLSPSRPSALVALACLACASLAAAAPAVSFVHLAPDSDVTVMHVQWSSAVGAAGIPVVQWGRSPSALTGSQAGYSWVWKDGGRTYQANLASMSGLQPGNRVFYRVGCDQDGWSTVNNFTAIRSADSYTSVAPLRIAWLGDMGVANAQALPYLLKEATSFSFFIDVGDFAYDLDSSNGETGDLFQQSIEPITSSVPFIGCPGNHEGGGSFNQYLNRFRVFNALNTTGLTPAGVSGLQPNLPNTMYYSLNVGPAHIVSMSTEAYFFYSGAAAQYAWLEADLAAVNRTITPWVIVYGHRSIYCSCDSDCDAAATTVREGTSGMEELLMKYGVDLWINGHEHNYERNYATYNSKLVTGASSGKPGGNAASPEVIESPGAPIYIIEGCAGDSEHHEPFTRAQPSYSAMRSNTYGYARMTIFNASHLLWEQVQTDDEYPKTTGTVIDAMLLVAPTHGPFKA